jgi:hypothetical protein
LISSLLDINTTIFEIEKLDIGCLVVVLRGCFGRIKHHIDFTLSKENARRRVSVCFHLISLCDSGENVISSQRTSKLKVKISPSCLSLFSVCSNLFETSLTEGGIK